MYDLIILGGGPAGLSAGLYGARASLKTLIIEKAVIGGLITLTNEIENYPGGIKEDSGYSLTERMKAQAEEFGAEFVIDEITNLSISDESKILYGKEKEYHAKSLIIASGALPRKMGCKGEEEHIGQGVSYCATCDGVFFRNKHVFVLGGGDSALEEAIFLTRFAKKVTVVHRRDEFRASNHVINKAKANEKIDYFLDTVVTEINGEDFVTEVFFKNVKTNVVTSVSVSEEDGMLGVFIFVGYIPATAIFKNILDLDENGYILANEDMETNIKGVFAAGDIRNKKIRQVVTATSDGAIAAINAEKFLE